MKNLIVVAHPDDEVLGFGATGAKLAAAGDVVQPLILCGGVDARQARPQDDELLDDIRAANSLLRFSDPILGTFPNIAMNLIAHIELVQFIEKYIREFEPDRVFTHHPMDMNDDHRHVAEACLTACRLPQRFSPPKPVPSIYYMEILSSTDWSFADPAVRFSPNVFVEVGDWMDQKLAALTCYRNIMRPYPHPRSDEALRGLAAVRGAQAGVKYAESFQLVFSTSLN